MRRPGSGVTGNPDAPTPRVPDAPSRSAGRRPVIDGHEAACALLLGGFGAWAYSRLGAADAAPWVAWGLLALAAIAVARDHARATVTSARWRMAAVPAAMIVFYFRLGVDVPRLVHGRADAALLAWDRQWLDETPALAWSPWHALWLTEALSACYMAFFVGYAGYLVGWLSHEPARARRFISGFCWIQAVGFAGYCAAPASGPFVYLSAELPPLPLGIVGRLNDGIVRMGCNGIDVFPSLHVATTLYCVAFDAWQRRWQRLAWVAAPAAGLCVSTLYLRYHYAADVAAGIALAAWGLLMARGFRATPCPGATTR